MRAIDFVRAAGAALAAACIASCGGEHVSEAAVVSSTVRPLTSAEWTAFAKRRVFFGHQSVGDNIVEGIRELEASAGAHDVRIVVTERPDSVGGPALMHHLVGRNFDPASKTAEFGRVIAAANGESGLIALHKYCFVDATDTTNADRLFAQYKASMDSLAARYPNVQFVHVTMPLVVVTPDGAAKRVIKRLLGRGEPFEVGRSVTRQRYNTLMRRAYGKTGRLFDLAALESTHADGSRSYFVQRGDTVYTLAPEYAADGAHLNAAGRRRAATAFVRFLAGL